jgi:hypothetical protein
MSLLHYLASCCDTALLPFHKAFYHCCCCCCRHVLCDMSTVLHHGPAAADTPATQAFHCNVCCRRCCRCCCCRRVLCPPCCTTILLLLLLSYQELPYPHASAAHQPRMLLLLLQARAV